MIEITQSDQEKENKLRKKKVYRALGTSETITKDLVFLLS